MGQDDLSNAVPHELLLHHAGFLRRLARDLVRDPHAAEDAVQDVMVTALEHPPRHDGNLHGWFAAVLKNLVSKRSRAHVRRSHHEEQAARTAAQTSDAIGAESESTVRCVAEAVLALDEPYRSTVLMRYFEDLTPSTIAERQAIPVATVKSRLRRALDMLRERMQGARGESWRAPMVALLTPSEIGKGMILMTLKTKLAIGCAVLVCTLLAYRGFGSTAGTSPGSAAGSRFVAEAAAPSDVSTTNSILQQDAKSSERVAVERTPSNAASEVPPDTSFRGSLRDPAGVLLVGLWHAGVLLTDSSGRRRYADAKESGSYAFNALPYGKYWVSAGADGFHSATATIEIDAARPQLKQDFELQPVPIIKVRLTILDRKSASSDEHKEIRPRAGFALVPVATAERPGEWFTEVMGSLNNPFGIGHFWQYGPRVENLPRGYMGILMLDREPPAFVSLVNYQRVLQTIEVSPGQDEVNFEVSPEDLAVSMASLRMQIIDARSQQPLKGARAMLWGGPTGDGGEVADVSGSIVFDARVPGEFDLHVIALGYEEYKAHICVNPGVLNDLGTITLEKAIPLEIKVVDSTGAPFNSRFSLGVLDPSTGILNMEPQQRWDSEEEGVLKLNHLGRRAYVVRTDNHDAVNDESDESPKWVSGNVLLDLRSGTAPPIFVIKLVPATRVMLVVSGETPDGMRFLVTDEQGLDLVSSRFYGEAPRPLSLPPGNYTLALLDASKTRLKERSLVVGAGPMTVELTR